MKNILVAVDFSAGTAGVVGAALSLAQAFRSSVRLVHIAAGEPDFIGYEPGPQVVRDIVAHRLKEEHRQLEELEKIFRSEGLTVAALLIGGIPVDKIVKEAAEFHADLVILGSHGHGPLHDLMVGSVTAGVLRKARCPVLVVPCPKPA